MTGTAGTARFLGRKDPDPVGNAWREGNRHIPSLGCDVCPARTRGPIAMRLTLLIDATLVAPADRPRLVRHWDAHSTTRATGTHSTTEPFPDCESATCDPAVYWRLWSVLQRGPFSGASYPLSEAGGNWRIDATHSSLSGLGSWTGVMAAFQRKASTFKFRVI